MRLYNASDPKLLEHKVSFNSLGVNTKVHWHINLYFGWSMNYYVFNWALKPQKLLIWLKCISEDSAERVQPNISLKRSADKEKAGNFRDFCEAGISHTLFFLLVWRQFVQIALTARGRLESLVSLTSCYLISLPWECCNSLWSLLGKLHFWFFTLSPSVRITVGSMTLFLDIEFLESWLLQELIWLDDPFFFFPSLLDHVYFSWPKYLRFIFSWKNSEMPKS